MTAADRSRELPVPGAPPAPLAATVRERYGVDLGALGRSARHLAFAVKTPEGWARGGDPEKSGFGRFEREILRDGAPVGWLVVEMEFGADPGPGVRFLDGENLVVWRASRAGDLRRYLVAYAPLSEHPEPSRPVRHSAGVEPRRPARSRTEGPDPRRGR